MPYLFKRATSNPSPVEPEEFIIEHKGYEPIILPKMGSLSLDERLWLDRFNKMVTDFDGREIGDRPITTFFAGYCLALMAIRDWTLAPKSNEKKLLAGLEEATQVMTGQKVAGLDIPEDLMNRIYVEFWAKELNGWKETINPESEGNEAEKPTGTASS
jgi:hypothetical protein